MGEAKQYDLVLVNKHGAKRKAVTVRADRDDAKEMRRQLVDLAVQIEHRDRMRSEDWMGEYSLEVRPVGGSAVISRFKA